MQLGLFYEHEKHVVALRGAEDIDKLTRNFGLTGND